MSDRLLADDELRAIAERRDAAPQGEWSYGYEDDGPHCLIGDSGLLWARIVDAPGRPAMSSAAFLANASQDIPRLLADLCRYRAWCRRLMACQDANDGEGDLFALADLTKEVRAAMGGNV